MPIDIFESSTGVHTLIETMLALAVEDGIEEIPVGKYVSSCEETGNSNSNTDEPFHCIPSGGLGGVDPILSLRVINVVEVDELVTFGITE